MTLSPAAAACVALGLGAAAVLAPRLVPNEGERTPPPVDAAWAASPLDGYRVAWLETPKAPSGFRPGGGGRLAVAFRNEGRSPWPDARVDFFHAVRVGWEFRNAAGRPVTSGRSDLVGVLEPGREGAAILEVRAPREPGRYALRIGMIHENVDWFVDRGGTGFLFEVEVR